MNVLSTILILVAVILFALASKKWPNPPAWDLIAAGLFFWALAEFLSRIGGIVLK